VERPVELPVAGPVQPVANSLTRRGRDRRHAAKVREGSFAAQPSGVRPSVEQSSGTHDADARLDEQVGSDALDDEHELGLEIGGLGTSRSTRWVSRPSRGIC